MSSPDLRELAILSIKDPAMGAKTVLSMPLPREALWTALVLVAVLNAALFTVSNILVPGPTPFPGIFTVPLIYCAVVAGGLVLTVYALFWIGRALGGSGSLEDIMQVIVWLQALRVVAQLAVLVFLVTVPVLSALLVFAVSLYGLYMLLHFINQAHQLDSMARAAGVLIASLLAIVLGLTLLISLFGGSIVGSAPYV